MFNIRTSKIKSNGLLSQMRKLEAKREGLRSAQGHTGHVCGWAETRGTKSVEPSSVLSATMMKKKKSLALWGGRGRHPGLTWTARTEA